VDRAALEREVARVGWVLDGGFSEQLIIGNAGDMCILIPERSWQGADPEYELYNIDKNVACWVRVIPTPFFAAMLLQEHGETPVEEQGIITKPNEGCEDPQGRTQSRLEHDRGGE
jgi:hypothetical protein